MTITTCATEGKRWLTSYSHRAHSDDRSTLCSRKLDCVIAGNTFSFRKSVKFTRLEGLSYSYIKFRHARRQVIWLNSFNSTRVDGCVNVLAICRRQTKPVSADCGKKSPQRQVLKLCHMPELRFVLFWVQKSTQFKRWSIEQVQVSARKFKVHKDCPRHASAVAHSKIIMNSLC